MLPRTHIKAKGRFRSGFTLLEVALALSIVLMMSLLFGAAVPVALRGTQQGSNYTQAALLAQHKIEQLRSMNFSSLSSASLQSAGVIDGVNADGTYDFSTTAADNLTSFFPLGTTGTVSLVHDADTGAMQGSVYDITVTIAWPNSAAHAGSYALKNKIINY